MSSNESNRRRDDDVSEDSDRDDDDVKDDGNIISNAQRDFLDKNNNHSKKHQFVRMCFGLTDVEDGGAPMLDLDAEPWNAIKKQDINKLNRMVYTEEIIRRIKLMLSGSD